VLAAGGRTAAGTLARFVDVEQIRTPARTGARRHHSQRTEAVTYRTERAVDPIRSAASHRIVGCALNVSVATRPIHNAALVRDSVAVRLGRGEAPHAAACQRWISRSCAAMCSARRVLEEVRARMAREP
jgi:hypothetical protein